jgi:hypothetical protein
MKEEKKLISVSCLKSLEWQLIHFVNWKKEWNDSFEPFATFDSDCESEFVFWEQLKKNGKNFPCVLRFNQINLFWNSFHCASKKKQKNKTKSTTQSKRSINKTVSLSLCFKHLAEWDPQQREKIEMMKDKISVMMIVLNWFFESFFESELRDKREELIDSEHKVWSEEPPFSFLFFSQRHKQTNTIIESKVEQKKNQITVFHFSK